MSTKKSSSHPAAQDVIRAGDVGELVVNKKAAERPLAMSFCWACDACARILAIQHPGQQVTTRGGEGLKEPPTECTGTKEDPHGAWPVSRHDYHSVVINQRDEIVRGARVE